MREIKFRAWDIGQGGHMRQWGDLQQINYNRNWDNKRGDVGWWNDPDFKLMQFTGLHDKNGKEIYDGDVVACIKDKFGKNRHEFWVVEYGYFGDAAFYVSNQLNSGRLLERGEERYDCATFSPDGTQWVVCEIIGNIYENPDLMEAK